jgi:hypothetical protein
VVNRYVGLVHERQRRAPGIGDDTEKRLASSFRHGDGASRITDVAILDSGGGRVTTLTSGEPVTIRIHATFCRDMPRLVAGILIRNRLGIDVFGTNTRLEQIEPGPFHAGESAEIDFQFDCLLTRQEYTLTVATQHWDGSSQDWLDDVVAFTVVDPKDTAGFANLKTRVFWRRA